MSDSNIKLLNYIKHRPEVYEKSSSAFWDDEHISKHMLEAHLNPNSDGASRRHSFIQQSADWIAGYCNGGKGKGLLDLGCGPGIYAELLADKGFCVTGIDLSKRSIEYAKRQSGEREKNIQYRCQDYLELDYRDEFDVVILIYCDFGVLSPQSRRVLLKKVHLALKEGGILILDGFSVTYLNKFEEKETVQYEESGFLSAEPYVIIQRNSVYGDTANTLEQCLVVTKDDCKCYNLWNQLYSEGNLRAEVTRAGFRKADFFDDVTGKTFTGRTTTLCVTARK